MLCTLSLAAKEHLLIDLQAERLGQHSPAGMGAREPSGQILTSIVHMTMAQLLMAIQECEGERERIRKDLYAFEHTFDGIETKIFTEEHRWATAPSGSRGR